MGKRNVTVYNDDGTEIKVKVSEEEAQRLESLPFEKGSGVPRVDSAPADDK